MTTWVLANSSQCQSLSTIKTHNSISRGSLVLPVLISSMTRCYLLDSMNNLWSTNLKMRMILFAQRQTLATVKCKTFGAKRPSAITKTKAVRQTIRSALVKLGIKQNKTCSESPKIQNMIFAAHQRPPTSMLFILELLLVFASVCQSLSRS